MSIEDHVTSDSLPPLILIANDQEWTVRAVESILAASGYRVTHAYTARDALLAAVATDPDLVILDQQLPDFSGIDVCRQLRANPRFGASLPIVITTAGPSGRPQRLNAYSAGAWEFYGQPLDSEALLYKLKVFLAAYKETRRLRRGALVDDASGLYNRDGLVQRANELLGDARRLGRTVACVGWSIPGESAAEDLKEAAAAFRLNGRAADALGWLGDGEFAIVAPGTTPSGAERLADRLREILAQAVGVTIDRVRATVVTTEDPELLTSNGSQLVDRLAHALAA